MPPNTARCRLFVGIGSAKYVPEHNAVVWRVRKFPGGAEVVLNGEIELIMSTKNKAWVRPPISVDFQVPMFTASGLHVRSLKIFERSNYQVGAAGVTTAAAAVSACVRCSAPRLAVRCPAPADDQVGEVRDPERDVDVPNPHLKRDVV